MRHMDIAEIQATIRKIGGDDVDLLSFEEQESERTAVLADRPSGDVWVFAYGSLIWNPAFEFVEVRRAFAPRWQRRFILKDVYGGRGCPEQPGVMAALDRGDGCHGLVFRISEDVLEQETRILWKRERLGRAYKPKFVSTETAQGPIQSLTFVVDRGAELIDANMSWEEQVEFCATGTGVFGTSLEYVTNLADHFQAMDIEAPHITELLAAAHAYCAKQSPS